MPNLDACPHCRRPARREKTIWSTNRPPVHVFVCDACQHTFLVHEHNLEIDRLVPEVLTDGAQAR